MDKATQYIKQMILNYPTLFKNRLDVLVHIFTVIGNGLEVVDGEIRNRFKTEAIRTKTDRDRDVHELVAKSLEHRLEQHIMDFIDENIDEIASDVKYSFCGLNHPKWYNSHYINNPDTDYALFFEMDVDSLEDSWRQAAIEFGNVWSHFFFVRSMLHSIDGVKCNYDRTSPIGLYLEGDTKLNKQQKSDFDSYNLITARVFELKTDEMIKREISFDKVVSKLIKKLKK